MKKTKQICAIAMALLLLVCLAGCTLPAPPSQARRNLEEEYETEGRFTYVRAINIGQYEFYDEVLGVTFTVRSEYEWSFYAGEILFYNSTFGSPADGVVQAMEEEAKALAAEYGLTLYDGDIYVSGYEQLETAAELFYALCVLYDLDRAHGHAFVSYHPDPVSMAEEGNWWTSTSIWLENYTTRAELEGEGTLQAKIEETTAKLQKHWKEEQEETDELPKAPPD